MSAIKSGSEQSAAAASGAFLANMMATTATIVTNSGMSVVMLFSRMLLRLFTSPVIRERILPVGRESKNEKSSVCMWSYSSCRISIIIRLLIFAIRNMRVFTATIIRPFSAVATPSSRNSAGQSPEAMQPSSARSMNSGFRMLTVTLYAIRSSTATISAR